MKYDLKLIKPNWKNVMDAIKEIDKEGSDFKIHNNTLNRLFENHRKNDDFEKVLLKVVALNTFYSAGVKNIHIINITKHIVSVYNQKKYIDNPCYIYNPCLIMNDQLNNDHCLELVKELARLEVKENKDGKVNNKIVHYKSFASKFCFFQNEYFFSIYDSYVVEVLFEFKEKYKTQYEEKLGNDFNNFKKGGLTNYNTFYIAINQFITFFNLERLTRRQIDIYLWKYGKEIISEKKSIKKEMKLKNSGKTQSLT